MSQKGDQDSPSGSSLYPITRQPRDAQGRFLRGWMWFRRPDGEGSWVRAEEIEEEERAAVEWRRLFGPLFRQARGDEVPSVTPHPFGGR